MALFTRISLLRTRCSGQDRTGEAGLARHEAEFHADAAAPLSVDELVKLLGPEAGLDPDARQHAIACYLAAGDGWRDAVKALGGAFAQEGPGLKERKSD